MNRSEFRFFDTLRVRWVEVDMQKIVFNGHYLMYLDTAVAAYWRRLALPYHETMALLEGDMYVRKATLEYEGSARYDDRLDVGLRYERIGNSSMAFAAAVFRGEQRLVTGELVYVFADPHTQTSRPVPLPLREALQAFEAGGDMLSVRTGVGEALGRDARALRQAVFVDEMKADAGLAWDGADVIAMHAVAVNRLGMPVATGRLLDDGPGVGRIGRLATVAGARGSGAGRAVLDALLARAREQGMTSVLLQAQASAVGFYRRAGFEARGGSFEVAGIAHQQMQRAP